MNKVGCQKTKQIRKTVLKKESLDPFREHISTCADCQDEILIASALLQVNQSSVPLEGQLTGRQLWIHAALLKRRKASQQKIRRAFILQTALQFFFVAACLLTGLMNKEAIINWIYAFHSNQVSGFPDISVLAFLMLALLIIGLNAIASFNWINRVNST